MVILLVGCLIFAYSLKTIEKILMSLLHTSEGHSAQILELNRFMRDKNIAASLQHDVRENLKYNLQIHHRYNNGAAYEIVKSLSPPLQNELKSAANSIIFEKQQLFRRFSQELKLSLVPIIRESHLLPGETVPSGAAPEQSLIYFIE